MTMQVTSLSHDGRGVAHVNDKAVFIHGALPGEEVLVAYTATHRNYDEGRVEQVLRAADSRVTPACAHFDICGGCSLQHLAPEQQILFKQGILLENLERIGKVKPASLLPPLTGPSWGYRRKARLGVKYVTKKQRVLVGFREKRSPFLADIHQCEVLYPSVGRMVHELARMIAQLDAYQQIAQIEVAVSDQVTALVFRNMIALEQQDRARLTQFAREHDVHVLLQPGGPDSVVPLWPEHLDLSYRLDEYGVELHFRPTDFTQVNYEINHKMIAQALEHLDPREDERILDLFCGIGNFTLPIARHARHVTGIEGDADMVVRASANAELNRIGNVAYYQGDLAQDIAHAPWYQAGYDKILLDPPRSGAAAIIDQIAALGASRIVYVSCHPGSLARDAGELVNRHGYRLHAAGVMDMFPHTAHVESIAVFEKSDTGKQDAGYR